MFEGLELELIAVDDYWHRRGVEEERILGLHCYMQERC
jgi:hypothetical protein